MKGYNFKQLIVLSLIVYASNVIKNINYSKRNLKSYFSKNKMNTNFQVTIFDEIFYKFYLKIHFKIFISILDLVKNKNVLLLGFTFPKICQSSRSRGGRGHWTFYYTSPQSLIITFSHSLALQPLGCY